MKRSRSESPGTPLLLPREGGESGFFAILARSSSEAVARARDKSAFPSAGKLCVGAFVARRGRPLLQPRADKRVAPRVKRCAVATAIKDAGGGEGERRASRKSEAVVGGDSCSKSAAASGRAIGGGSVKAEQPRAAALGRVAARIAERDGGRRRFIAHPFNAALLKDARFHGRGGLSGARALCAIN